MKRIDRRFLNISLTVAGFAAEPADNTAAGTQYIVGENPSGAFASASANQIARFDGSAWSFTTPKAGELEVLNLDTGEILQFNGEEWVAVASLGGDSGSSSGGSTAIPIVDDIVYGFHDAYNGSPLLTPANLKALRGRPFLCFDVSGEEVGLAFDEALNSGTLNTANSIRIEFNDGDSFSYAGFEDGKIHLATFDASEWEIKVTSTNLHDGEFFFNKADNALYYYDANNHKFVKVGGKHSYVVDALIDYVGATLPAAFNSGYASFVKVDGSGVSFKYMKQGSSEITCELYPGFSFANIQSLLADEAGIYSISSAYGHQCAHIIHDLYDGDSIFNKNDGCTYIFRDDGTNKSFVRASIPNIAPVLDILPIGNMPEYPTAKNDKFLAIYSDGYGIDGASVYNAVNSGDWGDSTDVVNGARYASSSNHKIYEFKIDDPNINQDVFVIPADIPVGASFFNKADNCYYVYDGTNFVNVTLDPENSRFIAPILDFIHIGEDLPNSPSNVNDKFIVVDGSGDAPMLYITDGSQWDFNGRQSITVGSRYVSLDNHKIYIFDERCDATVTVDIPVNAVFLNRADNCLYVYDGTNFINVTLDPENSRFIAPVLDIVYIRNSTWSTPSNVNDKLIVFYDTADAPMLYTVDGSQWDTSRGQIITAGSRYASLDNHKIYIFSERGDCTVTVDIPVNAVFLNRADNCLYVYDGSNFIKTGGSGGSSSESYEPIAPVLDILNIGSDMPDYPSTAGDKFIYYDTDSDAYGELYTAVDTSDWGNAAEIQNGARYASLNSHKIYTFKGNNNQAVISDILIGESFLNKADNSLYVYDGSNFINTGSSGNAYEPLAPVLAIVPTGASLPATAATGDAFLNTSNAKLYTATAANTWDSGTLTANGSRYASSTDHKIYVSNGSALTASNILNGDLFLNKEDNSVYIYDSDASAFIKVGSSTLCTEYHSLTASEVTAKRFSLNHYIAVGQESNTLLFVSGIAQIVGIDFSASGNSISWDGKDLDDIALAEGDSFLIQYFRA